MFPYQIMIATPKIENLNQKDFMEIPWAEILSLTNGTDAFGLPLASGSLSLLEDAKAEGVRVLQDVFLTNVIYDIRMSGGCVAMNLDFPKDQPGDFKRAMDIFYDWFENLENEEFDNQLLTLTIAPLLLGGRLFLTFSDVVLAEGFETEDSYHMILAFDMNETVPTVSDECPMEEIFADIHEEFRRKENEYLRSIEEANQIIKEAEEYNPMDEQYQNMFNDEDEFFSDNEEDDNSGIRYVKGD